MNTETVPHSGRNKSYRKDTSDEEMRYADLDEWIAGYPVCLVKSQ